MLSKDGLLVLKNILEEADMLFSYRSCEDIPPEIAEIVERHPEWCLEFHTWNGDPEVLEPGETFVQITCLTSWLLLQAERMLENVS